MQLKIMPKIGIVNNWLEQQHSDGEGLFSAQSDGV
jgi:hypothetical protein